MTTVLVLSETSQPGVCTAGHRCNWMSCHPQITQILRNLWMDFYSLPLKDLQRNNKTENAPCEQYRDRNPVGRKRGAFVHYRP